jgi:hypothetical protein
MDSALPGRTNLHRGNAGSTGGIVPQPFRRD